MGDKGQIGGSIDGYYIMDITIGGRIYYGWIYLWVDLLMCESIMNKSICGSTDDVIY